MQAELKNTIVMETATRTFQVTLPVVDAAFFRRQSHNMGWVLTPIRSKRTAEPKVKMTEEEFRAKLAHSSAQYAEGKTIAMHADESPEQFIDRLLYS